MNIPALISILILVGVALLLVLFPLWQQTRPQNSSQIVPSGQTLEEIRVRYQAQLAAIKDLMFDYEMGKVSSEDYDTLLAKTKLQAAQIRQQIDTLTQSPTAQEDAALNAEIESLIAQYRNGNISDNANQMQEVDAEIERLKNVQPETQLVCSACQNPLHPNDAFCSRCGQPITVIKVKAETMADSCPKCGRPSKTGDAFCAGCGAVLT